MAVQGQRQGEGPTSWSPPTPSDEEIVKAALAEPKIVKLAEDKELVKSVVVKGRLVSLIFKPKA